MRKARGGRTMPEEDVRSMLQPIEKRIGSSEERVGHRDGLIRLQAMIEDDFSACQQGRAFGACSAGQRVA
jgi:hypothetical protein